MTPAIIISICGLAVSVATFFIGRTVAAKENGRESGNVLTKLESISESIGKIDTRLSSIESQLGEQRDRLTRLETLVHFYHHD